MGASLVHFLLLNAGVRLVGIPPAPANGVAFLAAVNVTYFGQSLWVFRRPGLCFTRIRRFGMSATGGLVANVALMALFVDGLGWNYNLAFAFLLLIVPAVLFCVNKCWVFRSESGSDH